MDLSFNELISKASIVEHVCLPHASEYDKAVLISKYLKKSYVIHQKMVYHIDKELMVFREIGRESDLMWTIVAGFLNKSMYAVNHLEDVKLKDLVADDATSDTFKTKAAMVTKNIRMFNTLSKGCNVCEMVRVGIMMPWDTVLDYDKDHIHFRNGKYNLKTGDFSKRTAEDRISKYIELDWEESSVKDLQFIDKIIKQIIPECTAREYMRYLIGASFSGRNTAEQSFICHYGKGGSGKSTLMYLLQSVLGDAYTLYFKSDTFDSTKNADKTLSSITPNMRFYFVEELSSKQQNSSLLKDLADGRCVINKLYTDGVHKIDVCGKLMFISNHMMTFHVDSGVSRRLKAYEYKSQFVDDPKQVNNTTKFLKNINLIQDLNTAQKIAIFNYFAPYCKQFYDRLRVPVAREFHDSTQEIIAVNDDWQDFIDGYTVKCNGGKVSKDDMLKAIKLVYPQKAHLTMAQMLVSLREKGIEYNKSLRASNGIRGMFLNIALKDESHAKQECKVRKERVHIDQAFVHIKKAHTAAEHADTYVVDETKRMNEISKVINKPQSTVSTEFVLELF